MGFLSIQSLSNLYDLSGLENLRYFSAISIKMNNNLRSLSNLSANVQEVAYQSVTSIYILGNPRLRDVDGLRTIVNVTGQ